MESFRRASVSEVSSRLTDAPRAIMSLSSTSQDQACPGDRGHGSQRHWRARSMSEGRRLLAGDAEAVDAEAHVPHTRDRMGSKCLSDLKGVWRIIVDGLSA